MTIGEMKKMKSELGLSYEEISNLSGVPLGTVQKVFSGITKNPRYGTMRALSEAFRKADFENGERDFSYVQAQKAGADMVAESPVRYGGERVPAAQSYGTADAGGHYGISGSSALKAEASEGGSADEKYPHQGEYRLTNYLALPDDQRVEMIDGVFYDMSAPTSIHQIILQQLSYCFETFVEEHGGPCMVFPAPTDVQLDMDDRTIVQPDILIVCDPDKVHAERIYGAPDLVAEILSDSTRRKDLTLKQWKYAHAGVREYWIVDPKKLTVTVYDFAHGCDLTAYTFHDTVPVGIYEGACRIDFEKIWKRIARFYPESSARKASGAD